MMVHMYEYMFAGARPVQEVRTIVLESLGIASVGSSDELKSMCTSTRELHLGDNHINNWETVSFNQ